MRQTIERRGGLAALLVALAFGAPAISGCGSDSEDSGTTSTATPAAAAGGEDKAAEISGTPSSVGYALQVTPKSTEEAQSQGAEAAKTPAVERPSGKTVGFIHFDGQSTSSKRVLVGIEDAAEAFGAEVIACDPAGDPQKTKQCATSLIVRGASLITSYQHEPLEFGGTLEDAADRDIPWVNLGEGVTPDPNMPNYVADAAGIQKVFDEWLIPRLKEKAGDETPTLLMLGAPQAGLSARQEGEQMEQDMKAAGVEIVSNHDLDLANLEQDTISTVRQALQQHPDLTGVWTICDFCVPIEAQAVRSAPEDQRPLVTGNYSTGNTLDLIRSGQVEGIVDVPWEQFGWIALDQAAGYWARDTAMPADNVVSAYPLELAQPYILDETTAGTSGPTPVYGPDFPAFFKAKWEAEYKP